MVKNKKEETKVIKKEDIEVISGNNDNSNMKSQMGHDSSAEEKKTVSVSEEFEENLVEKYKNYKILDFKAFQHFLKEVKDFLFGITLEKSNYVEKNEKEISKQIKYPVKFGLLAVAVTFGFFGVWSGLAPLDSASIAEGHVILSDYRKQIYHLEGGIIDQILVKDGDIVTKGQTLLVLNEARTKSELEKVLWQLRYAVIVDERLRQSIKLVSYYQNKEAYGDIKTGDDDINSLQIKFNSKYLNTSDPKIIELIDAQKNAFNSFYLFIENSIKTNNIQIQQTKAKIESIEERIKSYNANVLTYEKEYERRKSLYAKQLDTLENISRTKIELQRYKGQVLEDKATMLGEEHRISEIIATKANFLDKQNVQLADEYKKNHTELLTLEAQYLQAKDSHERTTITAPNPGVITGLNVHTIGSAIRQNDKPLLEIIPQDDNLVIEAFIPSNEIDSISVGGIARIQLNAYKARLVPRIEGKVIYISADKFDKDSPGMMAPGQPKLAPVGFYKAKIEVTPEELAKVNTDINLYPGMPVTVFIVKGTRSFAEYLYSPIKDSFHKAFKEP
ncbi:MAG: HlyD family type I secretion periplasmic adaptor subunit [Candidatus Midichloriaceae bacterium]